MRTIPFHKTYTTEDEINAVVEAMKSGWLTMGPKTVAFEEAFKTYLDVDYSISLNSATAALHLALKAIGLKRDDEVIIPTHTFIATAEVVTYFDAIPILCDVEEDTHNIDVSKIELLITNKTNAIIHVRFAGQPCVMDGIYKIAQKYNLKIIEDAAHALPSKYKGELIGTLKNTDVTCFSFYATKTLSTGEGGMATTSNEEYAKSIKRNRLHGISQDAWDRYAKKGSWYYEVIDNGYKYNTTDMNASLGLEQLKKLEWMNEKRKDIAMAYNEAFANEPNIITPFIKEDRESSWHLYVIKINNRDEIIEKLKVLGIGTSVHFIPVHKHPFYQRKYNYKDELYHVSNKIFKESLSLPIYPSMNADDIAYVIENVIELVNEN